MRDGQYLNTIIKPQKGWVFIDIFEIFRYRELLLLLSIRGIKAKYAQSILGVGWAVIQPLATTLIFTFVFGRLAKVSSDGVPYFLFSLVGMIPWTFFSGTLTEAANSLIVNSNLINKVYFPRAILPLSAAIAKLLDFAIGLCIAGIALAVWRYVPQWTVILLPALIFVLLTTSIGTGMILSALSIQYRDVRHAMTFMVQLLMYAAPVVYPAASVPSKYQSLYALNPMVGVIEGFRSIFLNTQPFPYGWLMEGCIVSLLLFILGCFYFRRMERVFADVA